MTDQTLPVVIEHEETLVGACLNGKESAGYVFTKLGFEDFYRESHRYIADAAARLLYHGKDVDILTVSDELKRMGKFDEVGGNLRLVELAQKFIAIDGLHRHIVAVKNASLLRQVIKIQVRYSDRCYKNNTDANELIGEMIQDTINLLGDSSASDFRHISQIGSAVMKDIERIVKGDYPESLKIGFPTVDAKLEGLQPGDLVIVAGRPSMGKSAFAMNIAKNVAQGGIGVGVFTLEDKANKFYRRMLASNSRINSKNFRRRGGISESQIDEISLHVQEISGLPIWIDDKAGQKITDLSTRARLLKYREPGLGLIIIDYLQLVNFSGKAENRNLEVTKMSAAIKALAKELNVVIILLSQLSRACEARADKRPMLSDLRDSGAIEQDADVIIFPYRLIVYGESDDPQAAEIIVGKNRDGDTGIVDKIRFEREYLLFREYDVTKDFDGSKEEYNPGF